MTITSINQPEITNSAGTLLNEQPAVHGDGNTLPTQAKAATQGRPETRLRAAARRRGLTVKELAARMCVSYGYLLQVAAGRRPWSPMMRERVKAVLGEVPGQGIVYHQGGLLQSDSTYIREQARVMGLSLGELAERAGVSLGYISRVSRGRLKMTPRVQEKVDAVLGGPARIEAAQRPTVDPRALWDRMDAHGISQNEAARRAGISNAYLSHILNGTRTPSGKVLRKLHEVLFRPSAAELVVPAEVKVMGWKKDERQGVVIKGAGGPHSGSTPGGGTVRIGGRVPWGAEVEYAYRAGYDSRGQVSVTHLVDERGYGVMLAKPEAGTA